MRMPRAAFALALLLAAAGGVCIALATRPWHFRGLAFMGPACLVLILASRAGRTLSQTQAALVGATMGGVCHAATCGWIFFVLAEYAQLPLVAATPIALLFFAAQSLPLAAGAWLARTLVRLELPAWVSVAVALPLAAELVPMLFPWRLGVSQVSGLTFVQLAELGGPTLVDVAFCAVGASLAEGVSARRPRIALVGAAVLLATHAYGWQRVERLNAERATLPALRVGVVQPNVGVWERADPSQREPQLQLLRAMTSQLEAAGAELVLWPESAYPFEIGRNDHRDSTAPHRQILGEAVQGPLLFGAITHGDARRNSVLALDATGRFAGVYDKVHLLAFGEYTPFWDLLPPLQRVFPRGFAAGRSVSPLPVAGTTVGILNCYEDLLPEHTLRTARHRPGLLANFTNDAWFGDTSAPWLHEMLARMRAIETRTDLVRSVNTGVSSVIIATGERVALARPFERTSFVAEVRMASGTSTPWVRWGDWPTGALLVVVGVALWRHRQRRSAASEPRG